MSLDIVQAVLDSHYWLLIHVLMVVGSYGVLFVAGVCGHIFLLQRTPSPLLEKTVLQTLYWGTALLICGTLLGGVWAAQSWGRFWDWDPKEAWAFISSALYLLWIHAYRFKKIAGRGLAIGSIVGLMAITFTWYGVNYILGSGLHSYGFGQGGERFYYLYLLVELLFLASLALKRFIYKNSRD
jgi:ABC-type transport system involved in cytochrome c biogenesis permease subunit